MACNVQEIGRWFWFLQPLPGQQPCAFFLLCLFEATKAAETVTAVAAKATATAGAGIQGDETADAAAPPNAAAPENVAARTVSAATVAAFEGETTLRRRGRCRVLRIFDVGADGLPIDAFAVAQARSYRRRRLAQFVVGSCLADRAVGRRSKPAKKFLEHGQEAFVPFDASPGSEPLLPYFLGAVRSFHDFLPGISQPLEKVQPLEGGAFQGAHSFYPWARAVLGLFKLLDGKRQFVLVVLPIQRDGCTPCYRWIVPQTNIVYPQIHVRIPNGFRLCFALVIIGARDHAFAFAFAFGIGS